MDKYALIGGKPMEQFIAETARTAATKVGRQDLYEDIHQELWCLALSRPDLTDRETIRRHHLSTGAKVDGPEQNYSAAKILKLEGQRIARELSGDPIEQPAPLRWTSRTLTKHLKRWDCLQPVIAEALDSDRMPEQWRTALERHYRDGETATAVGRMTLTRARDRLVDIINSGVTSEVHWGPQLRSGSTSGRIDGTEEDFVDAFLMGYEAREASESDSEGSDGLDLYSGGSEDSAGLYGLLGLFEDGLSPEEIRSATEDDILCDLGVVKEPEKARDYFRKRYDVEYDLWLWAHQGKTGDAVQWAVDSLTGEQRKALFIRYNQFRDSKRKRDNFGPGVEALKAVRRFLCMPEAK